MAFGFLVSFVVGGGNGSERRSARPVPPVAQSAPSEVRRRVTTKRTGAGAQIVSIVAVGDIVMGATPKLPPDAGRGFFQHVAADLAGDVVLGNLEGTLSTGGTSKCRPRSTDCFAFQTPPSYAGRLVDAGFTVMNLANNHAYDFGRRGLQQTIRALERVGLAHTGRPGQIATFDVNGVRIAAVGFASYPWAQSLTDIAAARTMVRKATTIADLVIVTMHAGAEGAARQHVSLGVERFLGENRGDPIRFAHAVVDAGADVVIGHGPHVLRGMEWYKDRLIAYSLGNFAGYGVFSLGGPLSVSCILRIELRGDGTFETGVVVPTRLVGKGLPDLDRGEAAHGLLRMLSREDFGPHAVKISPSGILSGP